MIQTGLTKSDLDSQDDHFRSLGENIEKVHNLVNSGSDAERTKPQSLAQLL
jgi:hypothetical protein